VVAGFKINYSPTYGIVNINKKTQDDLKHSSEHNIQQTLRV